MIEKNMKKSLSLQNSIIKNPVTEVVTATCLGIFCVVFLLLYLNYSQPYLVLLLVLIGCLGFVIFRQPEAGIHIIIFCSMIFERWFGLSPLVFGGSAIKIYPLDIVLILTTFSIILRLSPKDVSISKKVITPIIAFFLAVVIWSGLSVSWGGDPALVGSLVKNILFYSLMFFLVVLFVRDKKAWQRILTTVMICGVMIIGFIVYGILSGQGLWSSYTPLSTAGSRMLAATHAFFLILPIFLITNLYVFKKRVFGQWDLLMLFIWLIGIIASLLRNIWLGIAVGFGLTLFLLPRGKRGRFVAIILKVSALAVITVFVLAWASYLATADSSLIDPYVKAIQERVVSLNPFSSQDESSIFRLAALKEAWQVFMDNPLFGIGFGQDIKFEISGNEYQIAVRELHNDFLAFVLQLGLVGFAAFITFIFSVLRESLSSIKRSAGLDRPSLIALLAFVVCFLVLSLFGTYWETNFFLIFFWLAYGLIIASRNFAESNEKGKI